MISYNRPVKLLLLPFALRDYDSCYVAQCLESCKKSFNALNAELTVAPLIYDDSQALESEQKYNSASFDGVVVFPVSWTDIRCMVYAARSFFNKPLMVYTCSEIRSDNGNNIELSSTPCGASFCGVLAEMNVHYVFVNDSLDTCNTMLEDFVNFARAVGYLKNAKIGLFGSYFNGISCSTFNESLMRQIFGTEIISSDTSSLLSLMKSFSPSEPEYIQVSRDISSSFELNCSSDSFDKIVRMYMALKSFAKRKDLCALTVRCHTELNEEFGQSACIPLSLLGSSLVSSCEADVPVVFTQLLLTLLSGSVSTYVDIRSFANGTITVGSCGYNPTCLCASSSGPGAKLSSDFSAGFVTNSNPMKTGSVVLARLCKNTSGKLSLHLVSGKSVKAQNTLQENGCPLYSEAHIVLNENIGDFASDIGSNHYALTYCDYSKIRKSLELFCRFCSIELS